MTILGFNAAFEKQPSEQITIRANFASVGNNLSLTGYALNSCELKIFTSVGTDTGNNMMQGDPTIDAGNNCVLACIKSGTDGQNYYARFKTTWKKTGEPDQIIERDLLIEVRQKGVA